MAMTNVIQDISPSCFCRLSVSVLTHLWPPASSAPLSLYCECCDAWS